MTKILAIDPGSEQSAWVVFDADTFEIVAKAKERNATVEEMLRHCADDYEHVVIEYPKPRGETMSYQLVDTIYYIGRFAASLTCGWEKMDRMQVKLYLTGKTNTKDKNVMASLKAIYEERLGAYGGGKNPVVGTKSQPGPLYGVSKDIWAALAVAVTWVDTKYKRYKLFR